MLGLGNLLSKGKVLGFPNKYSFNFDGSNDYLEIADNESFDFGTGDFSVSYWFKVGNIDWNWSIGRQNSSANEDVWRAGINDGGKIIFRDIVGSDDSVGATTISTDTWYHFCATRNSGTLKVYLNGSEDGTVASSGNLDSDKPIKIGSSGHYTSDEWLGLLDEISIFNTALSADDVAKIASKPLNLSKASSYDTDRTSNLKLWLRAGDKVLPEEDTSIARSDYFCDFDGTNDVVELGSDASIDNVFVGGATLTAWINPSSDGENNFGRIFDKSTATSGADGFYFLVTDESSGNCELRFAHGFDSTVGFWDSTATVALNTWNHVAVAYNNSSTSNNPIFYINGVSVTVTEGGTPAGTVADDSSQNLFIGNNTGGDRTFAGGISTASIYNTILDAQTIKQFAKSRFTPMRDNRFSVVDFDGTNDTIEVADNNSLDFTTALTISTWVKKTGTGYGLSLIHI